MHICNPEMQMTAARCATPFALLCYRHAQYKTGTQRTFLGVGHAEHGAWCAVLAELMQGLSRSHIVDLISALQVQATCTASVAFGARSDLTCMCARAGSVVVR